MPDPDTTGGDQLADANIEATFADRGDAEKAVTALTQAGIDASITVDEPEDQRAALRAEMRDEIETTIVGPGSGPFTKGMSKGVLAGAGVGVVIGVAVMAAIGALVWPEGIVQMIAIGAVAGAVVGSAMGGIGKPRAEREGRDLTTETGVTVGVHGGSASQLDTAESILRDRGPRRLDRVDRAGRPVAPSSDDRTRTVRGETPT